jgi:hypothetical protein
VGVRSVPLSSRELGANGGGRRSCAYVALQGGGVVGEGVASSLVVLIGDAQLCGEVSARDGFFGHPTPIIQSDSGVPPSLRRDGVTA